jgi:histidinol dehydrogenase
VLPTSGTARFSSPLGVYDFVKRSSLIEVSERGAQVLGPIAAELAYGEGLQAHARCGGVRIGGAPRCATQLPQPSACARWMPATPAYLDALEVAPGQRRFVADGPLAVQRVRPAGRPLGHAAAIRPSFMLLYDGRMDRSRPISCMSGASDAMPRYRQLGLGRLAMQWVI